MDYIGRMIAERIDHDDTQRSLGAKLGYVHSQIARYETRKNEPPIKYLIAFCNHYNVSADYILGISSKANWPRKEK